MMDEVWKTASEWSELGLPELPTDTSAMIKRAKRDGWPSRRREASGGGKQYPLSALPQRARIEYARRHLDIIALPNAEMSASEAEPDAKYITGSAAEHRDARLALLAACDRFQTSSGLSRARADTLFCAAYEAGTVIVPEWVRDAVRSITSRTLFRWRAARDAGATHRLAVDKGAARRGRGVLEIANDGAVKSLILAAMAKQPFLSADHLRAMVISRFGAVLEVDGSDAPLPSTRTFQMALKTWREAYKAELLALTNPDAFKNQMRVSGRSSHLLSRVNELWMIDASPADVLTKDGRQSIYVAIDVYPRRILIFVSPTPRASAVGLLIRRAVLEWGVPERIKTDNGSDFVARYTQRVMASLGIEIEASDPFAPWQKGVVERAIGTLQRDLMPLLPGFVGHSVADRKAIEGRKAFAQRLGRDDDRAFEVDLTATELQRYCDDWARDRYAHRPHTGIGNKTPFAVAAASTLPMRTVDVRALDMLLAPIVGRDGRRVVGKEGVRIDSTMYVCAGVMPGTEVLVRTDPSDMGRAYLFDRSGELYLGEAIAPELAGVDPAAAVARAQAAQKEHMARGIAELRREKFKPRDFAHAVLGTAAASAGNLIAFPAPNEAHTTPALSAALEAALPAAPAPAASDEVREMQRRLLAEENVTPLRIEETSHQRWNRAVALLARIAAGETVSTEDALWLGGYRTSAEYKGFALTYGDPQEKTPAGAGV